MRRLLHVLRVLSLGLGGGLLGSLGVATHGSFILPRHQLVKVDPAALLIADGAFKGAQSRVLKLDFLDAGVGCVLDGPIREEAD